MNQLQSLLDIQIASSLMKEQQPLTAVHPIDANYKKLGMISSSPLSLSLLFFCTHSCALIHALQSVFGLLTLIDVWSQGIELEPVNKLSREWKMLLRYLESGYLERMKDEFSVTLLDAFRVTRPTENERFKFVHFSTLLTTTITLSKEMNMLKCCPLWFVFVENFKNYVLVNFFGTVVDSVIMSEFSIKVFVLLQKKLQLLVTCLVSLSIYLSILSRIFF